tara:strand:+ start:3065 stop:4603 length:1539 start_codon:yes stop_codon:yes gene_type:complete
MATQWQTFPIEFRGGLISNLSPLQQGTNAVGSATILQNFESTKNGGYSKIKGFEKYSTTAVPGSGAILALKVISSGRIVVARQNASNVTEYYYGTGTTWTSMGARPLLGGKARHAMYNLNGDDKVVFVDGSNYPGIYNTSGNTFSAVASSTDVLGAEYVVIFKNTAFYAKGNNVYFTAPFTVDDFSSANGAGSINVAHDITGLAVFRDQLIIFTRDNIKRVTGNTSADFQVAPITDRIGCINGDTIQEVGGDIMYLAPDGIRLLSATDRIGDFGLDIASDPIAKDANVFLGSTPNFCSVLMREKAQYRIFAYVESEQHEVAKGLIATKFVSQGAAGISWSTTKGIKAFVADSRYSGTAETISFANTDGYVYILDTGSNFDSALIEAIYESPYMPISDPQMRKSFYKMTLYAEPTGSMNFDLNIKYDFNSTSNTGLIQPPTQTVSSTGDSVFIFGATSSVFNTATYGGELDKVYNTNIIGSGKTIAIRIEDSSTNPTFTLDTALLEFSQEDRQ